MLFGKERQKVKFRGKEMDVVYDHYTHGNTLAVILYDGDEQYGVASVNLPESFGESSAYIDENNLCGIGAALEKAGIASNTGRKAYSGFCEYPLYDFNNVKF